MRRLFPSLGPRARRPSPPVPLETKGDTERRATSGGPYFVGGGVPYRGTWSPERAVQDGLERVTWVYRCVDAIASDESRLPVIWRQDHPEEGDEIKPEAEPLWRLLNRRPNPFESAQAFRYRLSCQLLLCKQGVFVEMVRNKDKTINGLYLLPPHRTAPVPDPDKFVSEYEVYGAAGEIYRLPADRVLWIRRPHPLDPYMGLVPMEAAGLAVDVDFYARMFNRNFLMNDGRPGGIVNVKGFLSQEDADELDARFNAGPGKAGKVSVLESEGIEYVDLATTARDMQHSETRKATKDEILMAFGVPETRAGNASGRTYDNADAELEMYWRDTMRAHMDLLDSAFDSITAGGIEDDIFTAHDTSSVYVLNRDDKDKEGRFQELWESGLITADEFREGTGREPLKRPGSRVIWVQNQGKLAVGDEKDEIAAAQMAMGQMPGQEPGQPASPPGEPEEEAGAAAFEGGEGEEGAGGGGSFWDEFEAEDGAGEFSVEDALIAKAAPYPNGSRAGGADDTDTPPHNTGIMVSLDLPDRAARNLLDVLMGGYGGQTEAAEDLHITLSYLGQVDSAPFSPDDVLEAVEHFAELAPPVALAVSGIGHFSIPEGTATYASIDSPDLPDFHQRLVSILGIKDVHSPSEHGFSPHVTLAYTPPGAEPPDIPIEQLAGEIAQLTFVVPEVSVHWGDAVYRFPLRGEKKWLVNLGSVGLVGAELG